jgi:hypothetical protein
VRGKGFLFWDGERNEAEDASLFCFFSADCLGSVLVTFLVSYLMFILLEYLTGYLYLFLRETKAVQC